jgi:plastocyanin
VSFDRAGRSHHAGAPRSFRTQRLRANAGVVAFAWFVGLTGLGCGGGVHPVRHRVTIQGFRFQPDSLVIAPGDTVEWTNADILPHTSTASDSAWDSGLIPVGASWSAVIAGSGTHPYVCRLHPTMKGRVAAH